MSEEVISVNWAGMMLVAQTIVLAEEMVDRFWI